MALLKRTEGGWSYKRLDTGHTQHFDYPKIPDWKCKRKSLWYKELFEYIFTVYKYRTEIALELSHCLTKQEIRYCRQVCRKLLGVDSPMILGYTRAALMEVQQKNTAFYLYEDLEAMLKFCNILLKGDTPYRFGRAARASSVPTLQEALDKIKCKAIPDEL